MERGKSFIFQGFSSPNTTPVPDELFDFLLNVLTGNELKLVMYIIRRTYGFKKESDNISLSQMLNGIVKRDGTRLDSGAGLSKPTLLRALRTLAKSEVIIAERRGSKQKGHEPTNYRLNLLTPLGKKMTLGESQSFTKPLVNKRPIQDTVLQETVNNYVNVAPNKNGTANPREAQLVDEMVSQLGDTRSQASFTIIARAFDEQVIWSMLGNTKEAHQMDLIKTTKAKYFMGMAKKKAKEHGIDLGFKNGKTEAPPDNGLAQFDALKSQIGKRFRKAVRESTRHIES